MDTKHLMNVCFNKRMLARAISIVVILIMALAATGFASQQVYGALPADWDGSAVLKPGVLREASGYKMWYDGMDFNGVIQIGLATSKDGTTWKKHPGNPVLEGGPEAWDSSGEHAPFVLKEGSLYKMWYEGFDGSVRQLGYATSRDGINWTKYAGNPVLQAGPEGYDQLVAGHGSVLHEDGLYRLWYHAIGDQGIIIAYATSPDGVNWTKQGPVLLGAEGGWDEMLWGPSALKVGSTYWMWYSATGPIYPASIGVATSTNGKDWERVGEGPVVTDPEGTDYIGDPHVIFDRGVFKMWYGNFSEGAIYYAKSANGIKWSDPIPVLFPGLAKKAAKPSPFVGYWQAIDLDGSDIRLTIAGPPSGPFQITWTESYISFCDGGPGIVRGTGRLAEDDPHVLEADLRLVCFTTGATLDFSVTWIYDPGTDTISSGYITWHRPSARAKPCMPPPSGLTGWWPGDGDANDLIAGRNGVFHGEAATGSGLVNLAFHLDGEDDFIDVSHNPALDVGAGAFTVDLWVNFNDTTGEQVLVEKWVQGDGFVDGWTLTKLEGNVLRLAMEDGFGGEIDLDSDQLAIRPGLWYHFAATRQGPAVTLFMNGTIVAQQSDLGAFNLDSDSSLKFGHRGNPEDTPGSSDERGFYLNGRIDEVELYIGTALSAEQVMAIYQAGSAGKCKDVIVPAESARLWIVAFTYDVPAGTWTEGEHPYHFEFEWSLPEPGSFTGQGGEFVVSSEAPLYDGYLLLRGPMELRRVVLPGSPVCEEVDAIHPAQPTRFLIGWLPDHEMTYPEAQGHFQSITSRVVWDDGKSAELVGHEIKPFSWDDLDRWFQYVCTYTVRK